VEERERRIGLNEALFREVNERLGELAQGFVHTPGKLDLICECGNASCASRIEMDRDEYEQVRSDSATFAIVKGHEIPDVEEIVEQRKGYDVVRKTAAEAEEAAEKTDPRT
jgi:predicted ThiF/HesA family dinucleotide-utilizing enzyme